jgi:Ca2+-binding RTX toxin-like protein
MATPSIPSFQEDTSVKLPGAGHYTFGNPVAWGDYTGDGKLDFVVTGVQTSASGEASTKLYKQTASGSFEEDTSIALPGNYYGSGSVSWADYNGDNRLDLLLLVDGKTKLYKNTGNGLVEDTSISLPGVISGAAAWGDYTGDGKPDFVVTGYQLQPGATSANDVFKLYKNTGSGFVEDTSSNLPAVSQGAVSWADYNADGKLDLLISGVAGSAGSNRAYITKLYQNTGSGFIEDSNAQLPGVFNSSVDWADYNGDGKLDFVLTGYINGSYLTKLYRQTNGGFTEDTSVQLPGIAYGKAAWADYNGDKKPDLLLTGSTGVSGQKGITKLYQNTGSGFTEDTSIQLPGGEYNSVAWADYTGDKRSDFLLTGEEAIRLYKNMLSFNPDGSQPISNPIGNPNTQPGTSSGNPQPNGPTPATANPPLFDTGTKRFVLSPTLLALNEDTLNLGAAFQPVKSTGKADNLQGTQKNELMQGQKGNDRLNGAGGNDIVSAGQGRDTVSGGNGNDLVFGGSGADKVAGGKGDDLIFGGKGADDISTGKGADKVIYRNVTERGDTIQDFSVKQDQLVVSAQGFGSGLTAGILATAQFRLGAIAQTASERFFF